MGRGEEGGGAKLVTEFPSLIYCKIEWKIARLSVAFSSADLARLSADWQRRLQFQFPFQFQFQNRCDTCRENGRAIDVEFIAELATPGEPLMQISSRNHPTPPQPIISPSSLCFKSAPDITHFPTDSGNIQMNRLPPPGTVWHRVARRCQMNRNDSQLLFLGVAMKQHDQTE